MKKVILFVLIMFFSLGSMVYAAEIENAYIIEKEKYVTCIKEETTVKEFMDNIKSGNESKIIKSSSVLSSSDIVGTEMTLETGDGKTYMLSVSGDVTGDGKVTNTDILKSKRILIDQEIPTESQTLALDINGDLQASSTDLLKLKQAIIGIIKF